MYSMKKLTEKVHTIKALERQIEDLQTHLENLKDEIKEEMEKRGVYELSGEDWKVSWSMVESMRFDQKSFETVHPILFESFKKPSSYRRFVVK